MSAVPPLTHSTLPLVRLLLTRWQLFAGVALSLVIFLYYSSGSNPSSGLHRTSSSTGSNDSPWRDADLELSGDLRRGHEQLAHNYGLSEAQCDKAFPQLFEDIYESSRARETGHITLEELDSIPRDVKHTRLTIHDGELFIIDDYDKFPDERTTALLSSLHRALVADPDRASLPNIEFIISRDDFCDPNIPLWCMTRYRPPVTNFILPDFGFWAWPIRSVGSYTSTQRRILDLESNYSTFTDKIPKLVWRGSLDVDHETRTHLVDASQGQAWSDVEPIAWFKDGHPQDPPNLIEIEDHCRYQFIAHSEGNTFSGRQKYIQNCNSVIIAHPLMWIQPFHRVMVPEGPEQNYVQVRKDYSDLAEKMEYYLKHPAEAARIAANSVKTFRHRYLTPASEACYWRRLVREYARVSFRPQFYEVGAQGARRVARGTPYENYIIRGTLDHKPARHWAE